MNSFFVYFVQSLLLSYLISKASIFAGKLIVSFQWSCLIFELIFTRSYLFCIGRYNYYVYKHLTSVGKGSVVQKKNYKQAVLELSLNQER